MEDKERSEVCLEPRSPTPTTQKSENPANFHISLQELHSITNKLLRSDSLNEVCATGVKSISKLFDVNSAAFYRFIQDEPNLVCSKGTYEPDIDTKLIESKINTLKDKEAYRENFETGKGYLNLIQVGNHGVLVSSHQEEITEEETEALSFIASSIEAAMDRIDERQQKKKLRQLGDIISHELRNPLNIATGYLQTVEESEETKRISQALSRMEKIIDDMGSLTKEKDTIDQINRLSLEKIAEESWNAINTKQAQLDIQESTFFRGDRSKIKEVFENLFRNAIQHGGEDVNVEVGLIEEGFYVQDDGKGIEKETKQELFDYKTTPDQQNNGIGLPIIKKIIEAHGWKIKATESPGNGARFEIKGI